MKSLIASVLILSSLSSFAEDAASKKQCEVRNLSLAQKTEIQRIGQEAAEKIKPLSAELKASRELLNRILQNPMALKAEAVSVKEAIAATAEAIKAIRAEKNTTELFDILSPEQRVSKSRCLASLGNPRSGRSSGRVIIQPSPRPRYRPAPYPRYDYRYPRMGRGHPVRIGGRHPRRIFP